MSEKSPGPRAGRHGLLLVIGLLGCFASFAAGPGAARAEHRPLPGASAPGPAVRTVGNEVGLNGRVHGVQFAVAPPGPASPAGGRLPVSGSSRLSNLLTVGFVLLSLGSFVMLARRRRLSKG